MELNVDEALRYLGAGSVAPDNLRNEMEETARKLTETLQPRFTYRVFSLQKKSEGVLLKEANILLPGKSAAMMLAQCDQAALIACTLGTRFDGILRTEQTRNMAKAVLLDACGSAWVETGCDQAEQEIAARLPGKYLTDRFSPGYGDFPLSCQRAVCNALNAERRIGIHVSESFVMNPVKSVTAVIGISDKPQPARIRGCAYCSMREICRLRKGGKCCEN